ncbi:phospholipase D-like domain-containing protein [Oceanivirga miroungae]|uniref:Uncharacterized protein n=1 Tax=Oceanivirga miroungae TaxID=1130046 RepID=A0A6I8M7Y8_9FUSO|nr:hypothetical protein [Oceanivirga miroungae]VWL84952.1 hypothetical protein OMES3154_00224 [Oceanivirga miroungae]
MFEFKFVVEDDNVYFFARKIKSYSQNYEEWSRIVTKLKKDKTQSKERLIDMLKMRKIGFDMGVDKMFKLDMYMNHKYVFVDVKKGENYGEPTGNDIEGEVIESAETSTNIYAIYKLSEA